MKYKVIFNIAKTHLLTRKKQSIIAALGVTFGIGAYIILMSFMTGLNGLLDGLILNRTPHVQLYNEDAPTQNQPIDRSPEFQEGMNFVFSVKPLNKRDQIHNAIPIMNLLRNNPDVKGVTPQVKAQGFYLAGSTQLNGILIGVDVIAESQLYNLEDYIIEGSTKALVANKNGILLGRGVADKLALNVGDVIQIGAVSGETYPLKIEGFYQSGLAEVDNVQSYVSLRTAQRILGESQNYITAINLKLYDMEKAPDLAADLALMYDLTATDIQSANAQFDTGSSIRNLISYAVSFTLLVVAGFGIYNILNMLIYEKMNDIAILKATGFSGKDVKYIFLSQAMIIGLVGGILGLLLGYGVSFAISKAPFETEALPTIKTMPVNFQASYYIIGMIFAVISTYLAGYLPSRKAEKIDPVDIIRGQ
jgi:lipoprotein-releasing system permease protein